MVSSVVYSRPLQIIVIHVYRHIPTSNVDFFTSRIVHVYIYTTRKYYVMLSSKQYISYFRMRINHSVNYILYYW